MEREFKMVKFSLTALIFFILGFVGAESYLSSTYLLASNYRATKAVDDQSSSTFKTLAPTSFTIAEDFVTAKTPKKIELALLKTPQTPFEIYNFLFTLNGYSAEDLQQYLISLGHDQLDLKIQVAGLLTGKYPEVAFNLITKFMNDEDSDSAKIILQSLGQNYAKKTFEWMKANENEVNKIFSTSNEKYEARLTILNTLARDPVQKWFAYEQAQLLIFSGPRKDDKISLTSIAQSVASVDPEDAVEHAIAGVNGTRDRSLFNGGIGALAAKDILRAKDLALQNQDILEPISVNMIVSELMNAKQYAEAFGFVNNIKDFDTKMSTYRDVSALIVNEYPDRAGEFAKAISSVQDRADLVASLSISMDSKGYTVKERLDLMDATLQDATVNQKAFSYAFALKDWIKTDPTALNNYISSLRARDTELADVIQTTLEYFKKK
jgi:hypothetical protein